MAISAIPPITSPTSFITPLALLQQVDTQALLAQVAGAPLATDTALNAATIAPSAIAPSALTTTISNNVQSLAQLEQALFNDWVASLQNALLPSATPSLDLLLSGELNLITAASTGALQLPLGTTTAQSANASSAVLSLFNTMQLLGIIPNQGLQPGSQLDILA
jgi:hypothetical protein